MSRTFNHFLREIVTPEQANIDIVAVPGLNTANSESHAEATWTSGGKLWLKDFLPDRLPKARVLLFGYNTNISGVRPQAENLLNRLKGKRKGVSERPIVFVCHGVGGLIVKRALVIAKLDETYSSIKSAAHGIAFFGTPHQGRDATKLKTIASTIAGEIYHNPKGAFSEVFKKDSLLADDLVQDFRYQLEDYRYLSFYETRPYQKWGLIVDRKSATLGLAGTRERQIALDADHSKICKFDNPNGDDYRQVADNIVDLVDDALKVFEHRQRFPSLEAPLMISDSEWAY